MAHLLILIKLQRQPAGYSGRAGQRAACRSHGQPRQPRTQPPMQSVAAVSGGGEATGRWQFNTTRGGQKTRS
ncbi:hypothetical protein AAFF_G00191090 [Aldrovandia affinis]|uniref:Uncharacterized protein n=1 Tax=Aldrovandia affinis TaxID=143900 RepID=A0AAD7RJF8_9TELE|nr:hypothetical protein AAFF_G00191090 [Aldrovandia affinis]